MKRALHCLKPLFLATAFYGLSVAQAPADLRGAHGGPQLGRAVRVLIAGALDSDDGPLPVSLKLRDGQSRLETLEFVALCDGPLQQWWPIGSSRRSPARSTHPGLDNSLLMPFRTLLRLEDSYRDRGASQGSRRFEGGAERRRFLAAAAEQWSVSLEFDSKTSLLARCRIESRSGASEPVVIDYSDYREVEGIAVPFRVTRHWGERLELGLTVESATFQPPFHPNDFKIEQQGGQR